MVMGSEWISKTFRIADMSPLAVAVADLLGDVFGGIYHLDVKKLRKVDWQDTYVVAFQFTGSLSSFDTETLTKLVVLSHDRCLRLSISAATMNTLELMFHQRKREGNLFERIPTMEDHLSSIRKYYPITE